ncbi:hypothetical protein [Burkholderia sp. 8Y]|uniref:hypothetical protein n=1 Tax=Burkholderia sp. 8Y TaxID=2653133 RepID=UPI001F3423B4|nr:hypothetical protein [Burkholderia sp. 8Y]
MRRFEKKWTGVADLLDRPTTYNGHRLAGRRADDFMDLQRAIASYAKGELCAALKDEGKNQRAGAVRIERDFPTCAIHREFGRAISITDSLRARDGMRERRKQLVHDGAMQCDGRAGARVDDEIAAVVAELKARERIDGDCRAHMRWKNECE